MTTNHSFLTKLHGLRGIAVLYVVLFHFFGGIFKGGFSGVDLFFLLSGFLVTRSNSKDLESNDLKLIPFLKDFYVRRVARIFPMVLVSSIVSVIIALVFTPVGNLSKVLSYFSSSLLGFSNIRLLMDKSNYFSLDQEFNWFTQTWSLGVEEQFYFVFSIIVGIVIITKVRDRIVRLKNVFLSLMILSFIATVVHLFTKGKAESVFYMMHFRFWELSLGVCLYFYLRNRSVSPVLFQKIETPALLILSLGLWIPYHSLFFPVPLLFPVILGGSIFILSSGIKTSTIAEKILNLSFLQYLGNISYSLYLVHWIVLVFLRHSFGDGFVSMLVGTFISIGLSHLTYIYIESPANNTLRKSSKRSLILASFLVFFASLSYFISGSKFLEKNNLYVGNLSPYPVVNWGLSMKCHGESEMSKHRSPIEDCLTPNRDKFDNTVFVLGDSHAAQLRFPLEEIFYSSQYEVKGIHLESSDDIYDFTWGQKNPSNGMGVFNYVQTQVKAGDIVVLTFHSQRLLQLDDESYLIGIKIWESNIHNFLQKGAKVIFVLDSPTFSQFPIERCYFQKFVLTKQDVCSESRILLEEKVKKLKRFAEQLKNKEPEMAIFDLFPTFCGLDQCQMIFDNELMFFDNHHYTQRMAKRIAPRLHKFIKEELKINR